MRMADREIIIKTVFSVLRKYNHVIKGNCEPISRDIANDLIAHGINAKHAVGNFILNKPDAKKYMGKFADKVVDDYQVNHDWVQIGNYIVDATIKQFQPSVLEKLPLIGFFGPSNQLSNRYTLKKYHNE
jgi:hypothetical protein